MAMFEIEANGKVYDVEAPDMNAAMAALGGQKPASHVGPIEDVVLGGASGVANAAIGTAGFMGDMGSLIKGRADRFGIPESVQSGIKAATKYLPIARMLQGPGSRDVRQAVEGYTGSLDYQPQTVPGQYAKTGGEFITGLAIPGGPVRKAASWLLPAAASETAGQLTKGTEAEPWARLGAGLAGGVTASAGGRALAAPPAASRETIQAAGRAGYQDPAVRALQINPQSTAALANAIERNLVQEGYRRYLAPKTFGAVDELRAPPGPTAMVGDVEGVRKALGRAAASFEERDAARRAREAIDRYLPNIPQHHLVSGDAAAAGAKLKEARANYASYKGSERIGEAMAKAERAAESAGSGSNIDNAIRQQIKSILNDPKKVRGFTAAERTQMEKIVRGTFTGNALRLLGKLAPTGIVSGGLSSGAGYALTGGNPVGAVVLPAAGYIAKKAADAGTRRQALALEEMIRRRAPASQGMHTPIIGPGLTGGLLGTQGATMGLLPAWQSMLQPMPIPVR